MGETAHTPGPWTAIYGGHGSYVAFCDERGPTMLIADTLERGEQNDANARLISAAPDFLAACKDCLEGRGDWMALMSAAIAKAEGRS